MSWFGIVKRSIITEKIWFHTCFLNSGKFSSNIYYSKLSSGSFAFKTVLELIADNTIIKLFYYLKIDTKIKEKTTEQ